MATPGRLLDHMRRGSVDLSAVRTLVLDEADQMLEMGFIEDVQYVLEHLPQERVTALFSATMPRPIVDLAKRYMRDPEMIRLSKPQGLTVPEIEQIFYVVPFARKLDALTRVLDVRQPERAIVFCATKRMVDELVEGLTARGYLVEALHGDISQIVRERVLRSFRGRARPRCSSRPTSRRRARAADAGRRGADRRGPRPDGTGHRHGHARNESAVKSFHRRDRWPACAGGPLGRAEVAADPGGGLWRRDAPAA